MVGQWLCGSVGRVVASNIRGLKFESAKNIYIEHLFTVNRHRQKIIYIEHLFTVNCVLKRRK